MLQEILLKIQRLEDVMNVGSQDISEGIIEELKHVKDEGASIHDTMYHETQSLVIT